MRKASTLNDGHPRNKEGFLATHWPGQSMRRSTCLERITNSLTKEAEGHPGTLRDSNLFEVARMLNRTNDQMYQRNSLTEKSLPTKTLPSEIFSFPGQLLHVLASRAKYLVL